MDDSCKIEDHNVGDFIRSHHNPIVEQLNAEIERLKAQLPDSMQHCTIVFSECSIGHGRLLAANWIDHGCGQCEIDRLKAELAEAQRFVRECIVWTADGHGHTLGCKCSEQECQRRVAALEVKP